MPRVKQIGRVGVVSRADVSSIHIWFRDGGRAVVPEVVLGDRLDLDAGSLSITPHQILFFNKYTRPMTLTPQGGGLYRFGATGARWKRPLRSPC